LRHAPKSVVVKRDDVPKLGLGEQRRKLDGWTLQPAQAESSQGPLWRVMCSKICTHSDPLLAGLCIGTRRVLDRVLCIRVLQAGRKSLSSPRRRDASSGMRPSCGPLVAMCSITCCCPHLGASIDSPISCVQPSGIRKDSPDQRWQTVVWQATSADQGYGLGPQRNWQAVSEKSKWAVSGSNQRDAWKHWPSARECARI
jgi:hypothetical protein